MSVDPDGLAHALVTLGETIAPVRESTLGYRQSLIDAGMGKEAADRCAADYHAWLLGLMPTQRAGMGGKAK